MKKLLIFALVLASCAKEHSEYRYTPKFHVGNKVQFNRDIERDWVDAAHTKRQWDVPQPFTIVSSYYDSRWRDNWYWISEKDANGVVRLRDSPIDELSLQGWNGVLQVSK